MGSYQGKVYNTPEEAEEFVKSTVEAHPVVLFTKRFSPYCYKATSSFKSIDVKYEEILLSGRPDCQIIQDVLLKMTGARTVPRVFVHQKCIGGGNETSALYKEHKLKDLVDGKDPAAQDGDVKADAADKEQPDSNVAAKDEEVQGAPSEEEQTQKNEQTEETPAKEEAPVTEEEQTDKVPATKEEPTDETHSKADQCQSEESAVNDEQTEEAADKEVVKDSPAEEDQSSVPKDEESVADQLASANINAAGDAPEPEESNNE